MVVDKKIKRNKLCFKLSNDYEPAGKAGKNPRLYSDIFFLHR
jgi:hypothetical protein